MKRAFLILLVLHLILVSAAVQHSVYASPVGEDKFLGLVPFYELHNSLPTGVFVAGELLAAMGMGAQVLLSYIRVTGLPCLYGVAGERHLLQLQLCALWCGWTTLACCTVALSNIFPDVAVAENPLFSIEDYRNFTMAGAGASLLCYALNIYLRGKWSVVPGLLTMALCVSAGYLWCQGAWWLMPVLAAVGVTAAVCYNMEKQKSRVRALVASLGTYAAFKLSLCPFPQEPFAFRIGVMATALIVICCLVALCTLRFIRH